MTIKELERKYNVKIYKKSGSGVPDSHRGSYYTSQKENTMYMSPDFPSMDDLVKHLKSKVKIKPRKKFVVKVKKK